MSFPHCGNIIVTNNTIYRHSKLLYFITTIFLHLHDMHDTFENRSFDRLLKPVKAVIVHLQCMPSDSHSIFLPSV